ncbi:SH3 domain-containing protein [Fructilactobacillus sanfranciscensis]|uniref:SH3 domain-containing protein n=1 Tax=Fructilactobacillus sanfranciscensis TaxID=1625 RepID=UPI0023AADF69|nr:SH3 domain-containing protein [Fructilactobacillus sanfranciscensis]WED57287.1 SH3 domain-containing protein [Fructilactobacillus sanfranciscensis]
MDNKFTRAHNRMAMATGETKTRTKLTKSKHGWIKIAMGITFASTSLFLMSTPSFADENPTATADQTATPVQPEVQNADQTQTDQSSIQNQNRVALNLAAQTQKQADSDNVNSADNQVDNQAAQATTDANTNQTATDNTPNALQTAKSTQLDAQPQSGMYTATQQQAIRDGAGLDSNVVNTLDPGESINYDSTSNNDGYEWLHYTSYSGQAHYVAKLNDATPASNSSTGNISSDYQDFINQLAPGAQNTWNEYGVLPSVSMAQAIVESAWGKSAPGNNLYGIKGDYNGNYTMQSTKEYYNGHYVTIQDKFRAYPDLATSVEDHGNFLAVNPRYSNLLYSKDYAYVCQMLQADGYATNPNYANTLISIISYNNLNRFDNGSSQPSTNQPGANTGNNQNNGNPAPANNNGNNNQPAPNDTNGMIPASGAYTTSTSQYVRNGASTSASVAATLDPGETIYYDGTLNNDGYNWMHYTSYSGQSHWVANLTDVQPTTPASVDSAITPASGAYTATGTQYVRDGASTSANAVATLDSGDTIYYDGTLNNDGYNWYHYTSYSGESHWVADLSNAQPVQPTNTAGMTTASGAYTTSTSQYVRNEASTSASVAATLDAGDTIYYDGTLNNDGYTWMHYTSYSGQSHWVADLSNAQPEQSTSYTDGMTATSGAYTTTSSQYVRDAAGLNSNVSVTLNPGETIYFDGTKQADGYTWLHYTSYSGQSRWIAKLNLAF